MVITFRAQCCLPADLALYPMKDFLFRAIWFVVALIVFGPVRALA